MERVAFLVEGSDERIDCLLNPETVEVRRVAGVRTRGVATGRVTGLGLADDPLHLTGGGRTDLTLDLLFDTELAASPGSPVDVRAHTRRLGQLAENSSVDRGAYRPPLARFVWGKTWNVPGVVAAIAERFDRFDSTGTPRRSWVRLRFVRVADSAAEAEAEYQAMIHEAEHALANDPVIDPSGATGVVAADAPDALVVEGSGGRDDDGGPVVVRVDLLAADGLGNPMLWRRLAAHNGLDDPLRILPGTVLQVPDSAVGGRP